MLASTAHSSLARRQAPFQPCSGGRTRALAPVRAAAVSKLSLHVGETTIALPFKEQHAKELDAAFSALLKTFAEKAKAERPRRWEAMEYRYKGDPAAAELELFEVFCNPNAHTNAFDAKLLVTVKTRDGVAVTTEARLSAVKADLDAFLKGPH